MTNADLDKLLNKRCVPDAPEGLSARIIAAAHREPQDAAVKESFKWPSLGGLVGAAKGYLNDLQTAFNLPQPAYVAAGVVVFALGLTLGMGADDTSLLSGLSVGELADFMMINDSFVVSEWV